MKPPAGFYEWQQLLFFAAPTKREQHQEHNEKAASTIVKTGALFIWQAVIPFSWPNRSDPSDDNCLIKKAKGEPKGQKA